MLNISRRLPPESLVEQWRLRGFWSSESLGLLHWRAAEQWPDRTAVIDEQGQISYADLVRRAETLGNSLWDSGVRPGDVVSWIMPNQIDTIAVAIAIWRIGAVSNPIVHIYREHEQAFILDQLRPAAVIASSEFRGRRFVEELDRVLDSIGHTPRTRISVGPGQGDWRSIDEIPEAPLPTDIAPIPPEVPALVLYTSGTTANPKGAMHSSQTLLHEVRSVQREWAVTRRDVIFMASPLTHITGIEQAVCLAGRTGGTALLQAKWNPARALELIEEHRATITVGATPFLADLIREYEKAGYEASSLRQFICGGASVPPSLIEQAEKIGISACRVYGSTEFPTPTLASEVDPLQRRAYTDGRIAEGVELEIVGEDGTILEPGLEGELRVRGPECMIGYVDPALNEEAFDDEGRFYTGDRGMVDSDGYVTVTGRIKDIINRGGEKFSSRDIEDVLSRHPGVAAVAVVGVPGGRLGERVCAAVVRVAGSEVSAGELSEFLEQERMARQKIPEEYRFFERLPQTASGKVQKYVIVAGWEASNAVAGPCPEDKTGKERGGTI